MSKQRTTSRLLGKLSADQLTAVVEHILADGLPNDSARRAFLTQLRRNAGALLSDYLTEEEQLRRDSQRHDERILKEAENGRA